MYTYSQQTGCPSFRNKTYQSAKGGKPGLEPGISPTLRECRNQLDYPREEDLVILITILLASYKNLCRSGDHDSQSQSDDRRVTNLTNSDIKDALHLRTSTSQP